MHAAILGSWRSLRASCADQHGQTGPAAHIPWFGCGGFLGAVIAIGFTSAQTGTQLGMESNQAQPAGPVGCTKNAELIVFGFSQLYFFLPLAWRMAIGWGAHSMCNEGVVRIEMMGCFMASRR